ncbi:hypothetical protein [Cupriavidus taiwanensis]|uniref:hypothetical protein n=1 Tax=Cupriavidus taiwanensis TaxID=164546 RepID=UPI000E15AEA4|nr:hypothetical protein [Cupriavidus taiwanensis]SPA17247.1 hypothetical protein CBM2631_A90323 [Cupriavidus taiwanensis]
MEIIERFVASARRAAVVRHEEGDEYVVQFLRDGIHLTEADYHTSNLDDALSTAAAFINEAPGPAN